MNKPYLSAKDAPDLSRFDWEDALRLEDQLTEDERMLRDVANTLALSEETWLKWAGRSSSYFG